MSKIYNKNLNGAPPIGFGAPAEFGKHHFYVEIPVKSNYEIRVYEDFGFAGDEKVVCRLVLHRKFWNKVRGDVKKNFNSRLRKNKQSVGKWEIGKTRVDKFLGKELCVLGWALDQGSIDYCRIICQRWLALRPEERWWFYWKIVSETTTSGWRKAVYHALSGE